VTSPHQAARSPLVQPRRPAGCAHEADCGLSCRWQGAPCEHRQLPAAFPPASQPARRRTNPPHPQPRLASYGPCMGCPSAPSCDPPWAAHRPPHAAPHGLPIGSLMRPPMGRPSASHGAPPWPPHPWATTTGFPHAPPPGPLVRDSEAGVAAGDFERELCATR